MSILLLLAIQASAVSRSVAAYMRGGGQLHRVFSIACAEPLSTRRAQSITSPDFVSQCASFLMSPERTEDGIISQDEFASFLDHRCRADSLCEEVGEELEFERLSLSLQLGFVKNVCQYNDVIENIDCIKKLERMWLNDGVFGFVVEGSEKLKESVQNLCVNSFRNAVEMGLLSGTAAGE